MFPIQPPMDATPVPDDASTHAAQLISKFSMGIRYAWPVHSVKIDVIHSDNIINVEVWHCRPGTVTPVHSALGLMTSSTCH